MKIGILLHEISFVSFDLILAVSWIAFGQLDKSAFCILAISITAISILAIGHLAVRILAIAHLAVSISAIGLSAISILAINEFWQ